MIFTCITSLINLIGLIVNLTTFAPGNSVCLMAIGIYSQPFMWMTKQTTFDFLLRQVWHGQATYWGAVLLSVWNIVFISFERFMLINYPIRHRNIRQVEIWICFTIIYALNVIFLIPACLFVKYDYYVYFQLYFSFCR